MSDTSTSPDSVSYPRQAYGLLAPFPANRVNIQDVPGADPTGNDDCTVALREALSMIPDEGGVLDLAPGIYKFSGNLRPKSNTVIEGTGTLKAAPLSAWVEGSPYFGIMNENWEADELTDEYITVRGITIDYTDFPSADGTRHCICFRRASHIVIEDVTIIHGSSSVALLGCYDTLELGNRYLQFTNCGSDHWDQPNKTRVIGCHIESDYFNVQQMMNYNPDYIPLESAGFEAKDFVFSGNTVKNTAPISVACVVSPLDEAQTVRGVVISNNVFVNTYLVLRGDTASAVVSNNEFSGFASVSEAITGYTRRGGTPANITITGNVVRDAITSAGNVAVIRMECDSAIIMHNQVVGTAFSSAPFSVGSTLGQIFGNYTDATPIIGYLQTGFRIPAGTSSSSYIGWTDASGSVPRMYVQSTDSNWVFQGTDGSGAARIVLSILMRNSASELTASVPVLLNQPYRKGVATLSASGTNIANATSLTANTNNVTFCVAGVADGVRLVASTGRPQTVINSTADTLKVYPNNSGSSQIDNGGVSVPATIAAGKSKTFEQVATGDFRTTATT